MKPRQENTIHQLTRDRALGVKYACYDLRHGFCQDLLESGNNPLAIAELMGHANGRMVSEVYSHMNQANSHLQRVLMSRGSKNQGKVT